MFDALNAKGGTTMKTGNILCKALFTALILAIAVAPALAEGTFSHPPIGSDPHGKMEGDNPHHPSKKGMMSGHGSSSKHGKSSAHSRFSGHGASSGHGKGFGHGASSLFSEKGLKKKLKLDDDQSKKMHRLFMDYRKGTILKTAKLRIAQIELDEAVGGGDFDMAAIEKKAKQKASADTKLVMVRVQALAQAKTFLSEDQFKQFVGIVAHRMGRGGSYGKSGGHGGHGSYGKHGSKHHKSKHQSKHHGSSGMAGGGHHGSSEGY